MYKIDWLTAFMIIIYPLILLASGIIYYVKCGIHIFEVLMFISAYYLSNISVGIGLHRLWSHNSYKTNKVIEFILVLLSAGTLQGPALVWASDHHKHHIYTDKDQDPHSPSKYKNKFIGFLWSHLIWMIYKPVEPAINSITFKKIGKNKLLLWQYRYYWQLVVSMNVILPLAIGYLIGGTVLKALSAFLFIGLGRALQQQMTFCVNSVCHLIGKKKYTQSTASDIWWLGIFLLGENWHNFHHAFPSDYRNGVKWYHLDVHKWIIYLLSKIGLAWDLNKTDDNRIKAKIEDTIKCYINSEKKEWQNIARKIETLKSLVCDKLLEVESSSEAIKNNFLCHFEKAHYVLESIGKQVSLLITDSKSSSKTLLKKVSKEIKKIESFVTSLNQQIIKCNN